MNPIQILISYKFIESIDSANIVKVQQIQMSNIQRPERDNLFESNRITAFHGIDKFIAFANYIFLFNFSQMFYFYTNVLHHL